MTPTSFAFTVTVPRDARFAAIVRGLAAQAVIYAAMEPDAGAGFVDRVGAASGRAMARGGSAAFALQFTCGGGELVVDLDGESVREPVAAA